MCRGWKKGAVGTEVGGYKWRERLEQWFDRYLFYAQLAGIVVVLGFALLAVLILMLEGGWYAVLGGTLLFSVVMLYISPP